MKRRQLTSLFGTASLCLGAGWSDVAAGNGLSNGVRRIGWLSLVKADSEQALLGRRVFYEMMQRAGFDERNNLAVERRYAEGDATRLQALAEELVRMEVELIVAVTNEAIAAARQATRKIAIVMLGASSPVDLGFVASLAQPAGNVTGTASELPESAGRILQTLKEAAPGAVRVGLLFNPKAPGGQRYAAATERAARAFKMQIDTYDTPRAQDIPGALKRIVAHRMDALVVLSDGVVNTRLPEIASFALRNRLLTIGNSRQFTEAGGTLCFGPDIVGLLERTAYFVERILKGAKPAELPVEPPPRYDLVVNLRTALAMGRSIPPPMLLRATEVIE